MHAQLYLPLCNSMDFSLPGFSVHRIPRQEYWIGLPFPSPGYLPDPEIKLMSSVSPALAGKILYHCATQEA